MSNTELVAILPRETVERRRVCSVGWHEPLPIGHSYSQDYCNNNRPTGDNILYTVVQKSNNKWRRWMWLPSSLQAGLRLKSVDLVERSTAVWCCSAFIAWTGWTHATTLSHVNIVPVLSLSLLLLCTSLYSKANEHWVKQETWWLLIIVLVIVLLPEWERSADELSDLRDMVSYILARWHDVIQKLLH